MAKGNCVRIGCDNDVDYSSIEVVDWGFVCSVECSAIVEEAADEWREFGPA